MKLPPLFSGTLIARRKRFLADIILDDGTPITALCPNTGSMRSCYSKGCRVWVSYVEKENRKYPYTWEISEMDGVKIGINTYHPNPIIRDAVIAQEIPELSGYTTVRPEYTIQHEAMIDQHTRSRIDLLASNDHEQCLIEIKNVTLMENDTLYFPDAVTTRGTRHLQVLMSLKQKGSRCVMFYFAQRSDGTTFQSAHHIDPVYAQFVQKARNAGVELLCYRVNVTLESITLASSVPIP